MRQVLVIGGGIIGLLTARELVLAGADVTLVEMGETGREASWAGGGILSPLYPWQAPESITALVGWSQQVYPGLVTSLHDETDVDPELIQSGMLILDTLELDAAVAWSQRHGQRLEVVEAAALHQIEPELGPRPASAILFPEIRQLRTPRLSKAVRRMIDKRIRLREREEVLELLIDGDRAVGVRTPKGRLEADSTVICTGAWTAKLLEQLDKKPDIQPVRGQMILFYAKPGQITHITLREGHYVIPRRDGRVLFGSTIEHAGFSKATTAEDKEALYRNAVDLFPILKRTPIEDHWAGLRPGSPNGIPYIGPYPGISGLFFNAGHYRNGLVTAPASARLISDIMLERPPVLDPQPYALDARR